MEDRSLTIIIVLLVSNPRIGLLFSFSLCLQIKCHKVIVDSVLMSALSETPDFAADVNHLQVCLLLKLSMYRLIPRTNKHAKMVSFDTSHTFHPD